MARTRFTQSANEARQRIKRALNLNRRLINLPQQRQPLQHACAVLPDAVVRERVVEGVPDLANGCAGGVSTEPVREVVPELRPPGAHSASASDPVNWMRLRFSICVSLVPLLLLPDRTHTDFFLVRFSHCLPFFASLPKPLWTTVHRAVLGLHQGHAP